MKTALFVLSMTLAATQAFASGGDGESCFSKNPNATSEKDAFADFDGQIVLSMTFENEEAPGSATLEFNSRDGGTIAEFSKVKYKFDKRAKTLRYFAKEKGKILDVLTDSKSGNGTMRYTDLSGKVQSVEVNCMEN